MSRGKIANHVLLDRKPKVWSSKVLGVEKLAFSLLVQREEIWSNKGF